MKNLTVNDSGVQCWRALRSLHRQGGPNSTLGDQAALLGGDAVWGSVFPCRKFLGERTCRTGNNV